MQSISKQNKQMVRMVVVEAVTELQGVAGRKKGRMCRYACK